jgi:hypothetical protein
MSNVSERKCDLPQLDLECLLLKAGVPLKHWGEYFSLVYEGTPRSEAARKCKGASKAYSAILDAISARYFKKLGIRFPPKSYRPSRKQLASVMAVA